MEPAVLDPAQLPPGEPQTPSDRSEFVGADACGDCHSDIYLKWSRSSHGRAGSVTQGARVIPAFDGGALEFNDATVHPVRRSGRLFFVVKEKSQPVREFEVSAVVGGGHLYGGGTQAFFTELRDGKVVLLPFDYSVTSETWFCQSPRHKKWMPITKAVSLRDCEYPPYRFLGNGKGANCQDCHGSQIGLTFDESAGRFKTEFTSLRINCESCHGPGGEHVKAPKAVDRAPMRSLSQDTKERSVQVCMGCHSAKTQLEPGHLADGDSLPFFATQHLRRSGDRALNLDGKVVKFSYQEAHYWSDCFRNGSMTCVDCHDPHTNGYRDIYGRGLKGRFDDGQCTGCHASKGGDSTHGGHTDFSVKCTSCHMPMAQQAGVGPHVAYRRADHSIGNPRPDALGARSDASLDACKSCHEPQGDKWLREKWVELFGKPKPHPAGAERLAEAERALDVPPAMPGMPSMLSRAGSGASAAFEALRSVDVSHRPLLMRSLSALVGIVPQMTVPEVPADVKLKLAALGRSADPEVAGAALAVAFFLTPYEPQLSHQAVAALKGHPSERQTVLRRHIIFNLMAVVYTIPEGATGAMKVALSGLEDYGVPLVTDVTPIASLLTAAYAQSGEPRRAVAWALKSLNGQRMSSGAYALGNSGTRADLLVRLAGLLGSRGSNRGAIDRYREAVKLDPNHRGAREKLCVELIKGGQKKTALKCVQQYMEIAPDFVEGYFVMAKLYEDLGDVRKAIQNTVEGLKRAPDNEAARRNLRRLQGRR